MRGRDAVFGAVLVSLVVLGGGATAAEWGTIAPGTTTQEAVRAQYGPPTKTSSLKVEGYDTTQWIYEGSQAPAGILRMTVDFGLLTATGYQPRVVRTLRLEPKPGAFGPTAVVLGWGRPDRQGTVDGFPAMVYESGLVVYLDKDGKSAVSMVFTLPQPLPPPKTP